ncbi:MAG TPA: NADPH-dependent glutamate synthase [Bacilli bacterium]|mgnify:CR=1 FL=1|nr:MAG: Glutamate synthase (NADPH) small chain [Tenericutes bacterium ADurb.BinA124]HNZ50820.1 NADPH-dependent glutamate synthase [Bacilli bacterium]HPX84870.1 NADPH-dependent glutamate synthase [Bacilli bacterium]
MNKKTVMKLQDATQRITNFDEVALGYNDDEALLEAARCLSCRHAPCIKGCPVNINIPAFIKQILNHDIDNAYQVIAEANLLPGVCGRVCPQETQCEAVCVRGKKGEAVAIGRLERYVSDHASKKRQEINSKINKKVAIVGSGPAGLACSGVLGNLGYDVDVFESLHVTGGVLMYGIPEFRLPKAIVNEEIDNLKKMGIKFYPNMVIGKSLTIDELFKEGYQAVFVGSGAGLPKFMGIPGENLNGVFSANEFLSRINLMKAHLDSFDTPLKTMRKIAVVGGGNVAMDAARCAKRLNSEEVYIIYRRSFSEMPARLEEVEHAKEEGINFLILTNPLQIIGDDKAYVKAIECVEMILGEPDASGRRSPIIKPGSNFLLEVDAVIMALGNYPNPLLAAATPQLKTDRRGCLIVDSQNMTTYPGVFAGGDIVTGAATVILAMGAGKQAALNIHQYLQTQKA